MSPAGQVVGPVVIGPVVIGPVAEDEYARLDGAIGASWERVEHREVSGRPNASGARSAVSRGPVPLLVTPDQRWWTGGGG